jgi:hypothetical protein
MVDLFWGMLIGPYARVPESVVTPAEMWLRSVCIDPRYLWCCFRCGLTGLTADDHI